MKLHVLTLSLVASCLSFNAQTTFTSSQSGDWSNPLTWGGLGVPGNNDHIIVSPGDTVNHDIQERITRVRINNGGVLESNDVLRVRGAYYINGVHNGTGQVRMIGNNDTISGSGTIATTALFRINTARTIQPGSIITRNSQNIRCPNNDTLRNQGVLILNGNLNGNNSTTFVNDENAIFTISRAISNNLTLEASATGNIVLYNRTGTGNQNIKQAENGYYDLIITGNNNNSDKRLVGPTRVLNDFTLNSSTFEHVDTFSLFVGGDFNISGGNYEADNGTVLFNGSAPQTINGTITFNDIVSTNPDLVSIGADSVRVSGTVSVRDGTFNTNNRLVLISDINGDAAIGQISTGSSVIGEVEVQRYIIQGRTDWRFMGSPITNATFEDWDDDFITAGFQGSDFPNFHFTSLLGYNETEVGHLDSGYYEVNASDAIPVGEGFAVYCGDSLNGTNPFLIEVVGPINQGTINLNVSYTPSTGLADDGWNLVSNPYPSSIDWDSPAPNWVRVGVDSAIYIYNANADAYASYSSGLGTNGATNIIASGQAFFVKANTVGAQLIITEGAKKDTVSQFLNSIPSDDAWLKIKAANETTSHECALRINEKATNGFDNEFEAYHFPITAEGAISVLLEDLDKNMLNIQAIKVDTQLSIPIAILGPAGRAALSFELTRFKNEYCFAFVDSRGNITSVEDGQRINLTLEEDTTWTSIRVSSFDSNDGCGESLSVPSDFSEPLTHWFTDKDQLRTNIDPSKINGDYTIFDLAGAEVKTGQLKQVIDISELPVGVYVLATGNQQFKFLRQP